MVPPLPWLAKLKIVEVAGDDNPCHRVVVEYGVCVAAYDTGLSLALHLGSPMRRIVEPKQRIVPTLTSEVIPYHYNASPTNLEDPNERLASRAFAGSPKSSLHLGT